MNKEVKELIDSLKDSAENPVFGKNIDGEGVDNFAYFTSHESKILLDYINGLEELIDYLERSNNRREETIIELRNEVVSYNE